MSGAFDAAQRRALEAALRDGQELLCPVCSRVLSEQTVQAPESVSYVRRRVWVLCPGCMRTASLDVKKR
jgi:hypothetical protein